MRLMVISAILLAPSLLASCGLDRFHGQIEVMGGHDAHGPGDQIYFHTAYAEDHPDRLAALILPDDWPDRPTVRGEDGRWRLDPPIEPVWLHGAELDPPVELIHAAGEWGRDYALHPDSGANWLPAATFPGRSPFEMGDGEARERLAQGLGVYQVLQLDDQQPYSDHRILGATLGPDGELRWVELMTLSFEDRRSSTTRFLHETMVWTEQGVAAVGFAAALIGGIVLMVHLVDEF